MLGTLACSSAQGLATVAPKTAPLPLSLSLPPCALQAPATPLRLSFSFEPAPAAVQDAFRSGDPERYLEAARRTEYVPPEGDDAQAALYDLGLQKEASEKAFLAALKAPAPKLQRSTRIDYEEFGRLLARWKGLDHNVFRHAEEKREILKASGYDALTGPGGRRIPLDQADDVRVGKAFLNVLRAFEKRAP